MYVIALGFLEKLISSWKVLIIVGIIGSIKLKALFF